MPDQNTVLVIATAVITVLAVLGLYRMRAAAKRAEPKALGALVLAELHAAERLVAAKEAAAQAAMLDAKNAASELAGIKAQVAGVPSAPPAA